MITAAATHRQRQWCQPAEPRAPFEESYDEDNDYDDGNTNDNDGGDNHHHHHLHDDSDDYGDGDYENATVVGKGEDEHMIIVHVLLLIRIRFLPAVASCCPFNRHDHQRVNGYCWYRYSSLCLWWIRDSGVSCIWQRGPAKARSSDYVFNGCRPQWRVSMAVFGSGCPTIRRAVSTKRGQKKMLSTHVI